VAVCQPPADVTGHGIGPALLASVCHAYARSSFSTERALSMALERINQDLGADLTTGRFVTFVAAVCCPGCSDVRCFRRVMVPSLSIAIQKTVSEK
jgi:hypothetical protein